MSVVYPPVSLCVAFVILYFLSNDYLSYKLGTSLHDTAYTSCHVSYTDPDSKETIESTYTPDSKDGTGQVLEVNEKVNSTGEAYELAKKRLPSLYER